MAKKLLNVRCKACGEKYCGTAKGVTRWATKHHPAECAGPGPVVPASFLDAPPAEAGSSVVALMPGGKKVQYLARVNLMSRLPYWEAAGTPASCSPACETYWCM